MWCKSKVCLASLSEVRTTKAPNLVRIAVATTILVGPTLKSEEFDDHFGFTPIRAV